ncbi:MAG: Vitamin B12 dependent methionine synthase activation subunit [Lachnospiraceae bacterium]|nr:Vitamin B12 dependent methionine synthase activation subunit [Lachnospiraceae bacterium]
MSAVLREVSREQIHINEREFAARLGQPVSALQPGLREECEELLSLAASYRYCFRRTVVTRPGEDRLDLGFGDFHSHALTLNLKGCEEAVLFAATLGAGVDRLMKRLSVTSPARHFVVNALSSAEAEALCDLANREIATLVLGETGCICAPRFSPGYGDVPLSIQPGFLQFVNAGKLLGITLSEAYFMYPTKSVTAVVGIREQ